MQTQLQLKTSSERRGVTVAIVGTAGRGVDRNKMTRKLFDKMIDYALAVIERVFKLRTTDVTLVSGGAAGADHVAVALWLRQPSAFANLHLFLPCALVPRATESHSPRALDTGSSDWRSNPGRVMNSLHIAFASRTGCDSLRDLALAQARGAVVDSSHHGFHRRNSAVAKADYLIAFTWSESDSTPKDGGTLDTWKKCRGRKLHVRLSLLKDEQSVSGSRTHPQLHKSIAKSPETAETAAIECQKQQLALAATTTTTSVAGAAEEKHSHHSKVTDLLASSPRIS